MRSPRGVLVRVATSDTTVFVGLPRSLATIGDVAVGKQAGQEAVVWAQDGDGLPQTATGGSIAISLIELQSGGTLDAILVDIRKDEDEFGAALRISGQLSGTWP